jgi:hypothetical protein
VKLRPRAIASISGKIITDPVELRRLIRVLLVIDSALIYSQKQGPEVFSYQRKGGNHV